MSTPWLLGIVAVSIPVYIFIGFKVNIYLEVWRGWEGDDAFGFAMVWPLALLLRGLVWECILKPIGWGLCHVSDAFESVYKSMRTSAENKKARVARCAQDLPKASVVKE